MDPAGLVEVGRAGPARAEPRAEAAIVFEVIPGALVHPTGESRAGWTLVEDASGAVGWVARGTLSARRPGLASPPAPGHPVAEAALPDDDAEELAARAATSPVEPTVERSAGGEAAAGAPGLAVRSLFQPRWVRARASLGVSSFSMSFSSNGTTPLSAYRLSSSAMAAFAGVEAGMWRGRWCAALDGLYGVTVGMPSDAAISTQKILNRARILLEPFVVSRLQTSSSSDCADKQISEDDDLDRQFLDELAEQGDLLSLAGGRWLPAPLRLVPITSQSVSFWLEVCQAVCSYGTGA